MRLIKIIPGPLLVFLGAFCLSFGGIIVKSFESANLWQILFWRQTFFAIIVALYLLLSYKKNVFKSFSNKSTTLKMPQIILNTLKHKATTKKRLRHYVSRTNKFARPLAQGVSDPIISDSFYLLSFRSSNYSIKFNLLN